MSGAPHNTERELASAERGDACNTNDDCPNAAGTTAECGQAGGYGREEWKCIDSERVEQPAEERDTECAQN